MDERKESEVPDEKTTIPEDRDIEKLRIDLYTLFIDFKKLTKMIKAKHDSLGENREIFDIHSFNEEEQGELNDWNKRFHLLLRKAKRSNQIEKEFIERYKRYGSEEWENDPFWKKVKNHFEAVEKSEEKIIDLGKQKEIVSLLQKKRIEDYKLAAKITGITIAIPLIIGLIYLIDKYLVTASKISGIEESTRLSTQAKETAEGELKKSGSSIKTHLYYQAAMVGTQSFFSPVKKLPTKFLLENDQEIQELVNEANGKTRSSSNNSIKPRMVATADPLDTIHRKYQQGIKEGRKSAITQCTEKELYDKYNKSRNKSDKNNYLELFKIPKLEPKTDNQAKNKL